MRTRHTLQIRTPSTYFMDRGTQLVRKVKHLGFGGVESYECPFSRQEAKCCLYSLVMKVRAVLEYHHNVEEVAHLDV